MVKIKYEDNTGCNDCIIECADKDQAERMIEAEVITAEREFKEKYGNWMRSSDFVELDGHVYTEVWVDGAGIYRRWTRLFDVDRNEFGL